MSSKKFCGYYFRHQAGDHVVAFIPSLSADGAFLQVITDRRSFRFSFPGAQFGKEIAMGNCRFSERGIHIDLPGMNGDLSYFDLTPLKSDIMGPFRFFPMECRHRIVSMRHRLAGSLTIEKETYGFDGGTGYLEGDSGFSFPKRYLWLQANDFPDGSSVVLSVAVIPFCGLRFEGCICALIRNGKEYRLATYRGAKAAVSPHKVILRQGSLTLKAEIQSDGDAFSLASPQLGKMRGTIRESNNARISFQLEKKGQVLGKFLSSNAGFENFGYPLG